MSLYSVCGLFIDIHLLIENLKSSSMSELQKFLWPTLKSMKFKHYKYLEYKLFQHENFSIYSTSEIHAYFLT